MTWDDLITMLNEIPESKRNETAIFYLDGEDFIIDALDKVSKDSLISETESEDDEVYCLTD